MTSKRKIHVSLSIHYTGVGFTSAAVALAQNMPSDFDPVIYAPQLVGRFPPGVRHIRQLPPIVPRSIAYRPAVEAWARHRNEINLLKAVLTEGPGALVWLWPGAKLQLQRKLKKAGAVIIREMINTHAGTARRILDAEYEKLGLSQTYPITAEDQANEKEQLALADLVVSPSESVDESLNEWGVPANRIVRTSFGWEPRDFNGTLKADLPQSGIKAIFVGTVCVRKGIHLALAAWDRANVNGTFVIIGPMGADAEPLVAPYRDRTDVKFIPFTRDLGSWYRAADFMFFPSLEEGAPLVCYQAGGAGLPILTSPMGRGRLVENDVTGFVVEPHDEQRMVLALRALAEDAELRCSLGNAIRKRALSFDWASAARQRAEAFTRLED